MDTFTISFVYNMRYVVIRREWFGERNRRSLLTALKVNVDILNLGLLAPQALSNIERVSTEAAKAFFDTKVPSLGFSLLCDAL
uniref:hypothetical protein n=1 Tax=Rothia dentocariosa TaxID=2047 RepID=UPI003FA36071